ncbi:Peroxisomal membrane protein PEX29 [Erysiphe neolycopersici]|uniref:Peroxisomal membrane protein PEX29 n=1 Tax=Erysiphe neolycopersici TaxID=212602 RepID=A0A420HQ44_9PEZI|nr:Peroxisomal membrane protein PEX29 [Erysiphe neolycopersici]
MQIPPGSENVDTKIRDQMEANKTSFSEDQGFSDIQQQKLDKIEVPLTTGSSGNEGQISDQLAEKLLHRISVSEDPFYNSELTGSHGKLKHRARRAFSLQLMSSNFRQFSTRIGAIFSLQRKIIRILSWSSNSQTISFLAIYTFVCLEPHLIIILPLVFTLLLLTNYYSTRYPSVSIAAHESENLISDEPITCAPNAKPIKERSKNFFRNLRDIQNVMEDYSKVHDQITKSFTPLIDFSNEEMSCTIFVFVFFSSASLLIISHMVPWRLIMLLSGWTVIGVNHPYISRKLLVAPENFVRNKRAKVDGFVSRLIAKNKILSPSETREVEIFELQLLSSAGEWVPFLYCRSPFISSFGAGTELDRPKGSRFLEDVQPPHGWEWTDEKWTLDFSSHEWVEERVITGVEIEIEGERWVYDVCYENDMKDTSDENGKQILLSTWEGGINNPTKMAYRRGEWRRRRWFRIVKRKWPRNLQSS